MPIVSLVSLYQQIKLKIENDMNAQTLSNLKDKPLFTLTVEQFLDLQQSVSAKENSPQTTDVLSKIIGIEEAVKLTGYKRATLYRKISTGAIPHFKRNGKILFLREELENWLLANRKETTEEALARLDESFLQKRR
jgi:phage DNA-binding protein, excisionase family